MNVLWIGLSIFTVILVTFFIVMAITKGASFLFKKGHSEGPLRSEWVAAQVYSGDDSLHHPDLKKMAELQDDELVGGTENI